MSSASTFRTSIHSLNMKRFVSSANSLMGIPEILFQYHIAVKRKVTVYMYGLTMTWQWYGLSYPILSYPILSIYLSIYRPISQLYDTVYGCINSRTKQKIYRSLKGDRAFLTIIYNFISPSKTVAKKRNKKGKNIYNTVRISSIIHKVLCKVVTSTHYAAVLCPRQRALRLLPMSLSRDFISWELRRQCIGDFWRESSSVYDRQ